MVDRRVTKKLGVDVQESEIVAVAFGQKSRDLTTVLPNVRLSPLRAESVTAGVGDLSFLNGVDAIIGLDVLTRSSVSIDYETRQVAFGPLVPREPTVQLEGTPPFLTVRLALAGRPIRRLVDTGSWCLVLFERRMRDRLPHMLGQGEKLLNVSRSAGIQSATHAARQRWGRAVPPSTPATSRKRGRCW